jgi:hypothetical protein
VKVVIYTGTLYWGLCISEGGDIYSTGTLYWGLCISEGGDIYRDIILGFVH